MRIIYEIERELNEMKIIEKENENKKR